MAAPEPAVAREYNAMKNKYNSIVAKINELDVERNEHALVVSSMEKLEPTRKCFRLVSGVLVERTVGEVLPAVKKNLEGLESVIKQLHTELEKTEKDLSAFAAKHRLRTQDDEEAPAAVPAAAEKKGSVGVLV